MRQWYFLKFSQLPVIGLKASEDVLFSLKQLCLDLKLNKNLKVHWFISGDQCYHFCSCSRLELKLDLYYVNRYTLSLEGTKRTFL